MNKVKFFEKLHDDSFEPIKDDGRFVIHSYLKGEGGRPIKRLIPPYNTLPIPTGIIVRTIPQYIVTVESVLDRARHSVFPLAYDGINGGLVADTEFYILLYNGGFQAAYIEHDTAIARLLMRLAH